MKKLLTLFFLFITTLGLQAQSSTIQGKLLDSEKNPVAFANVVLHNAADSSIHKVEASNEKGAFKMMAIPAGSYFLKASFVGFGEVTQTGIDIKDGQEIDLGILSLVEGAVQVATATVTASRVMVEVKPDRTVFNVDGTINSTGDNALELMRKAPGVLVDNNENINVLGRAGVMVYIDGKQLPLSGEDLSEYLKNIPADQIDRIDIISSPGAKYDAEGNAGIIDIRLKRDKSHGANGSVRGTITRGQLTRGNVNATGNFRNKFMNVFGTAGYGNGESFMTMNFRNFQNDLLMDETNRFDRAYQNNNYRLGADFYVAKNHVIGVLASGFNTQSDHLGANEVAISDINGTSVDSVLVANSVAMHDRGGNTFNVNYRFDDAKAGRSLNVDLDYGSYNTLATRFLPNQYFAADDVNRENPTTIINNFFDTPTDIDIYTFKTDYEDKLWDGKLGAGVKVSKVVSDNVFHVYNGENTQALLDSSQSNTFVYDETVYAGYLNYVRKINEKVGFSAGLRAELTDAVGDLSAFLPELAEPPVEQNYWRFFPNLGVTWQVKPMHALAFNYGRRINRPDYNVLNPFNNRLSEISYERGNPRLQPEIVNNVEVGYTYAYRYNFKLAYSRTIDQITRLIGPDLNDPRASFISWENLAEQRIISFNASIPAQINEKWSIYFNGNARHINNQADYGENGVVDVQAFSYNFYMQNTITLPWDFKGEISGWYSGPGVWGGVFLYEPQWSLNFGLQRKFFEDKMNVRLSFNDVFYQSYWSGVSEFNGLRGEGEGRWDSRTVNLSIGYNFGNQNVKSRKRKTGLEDEAGRVSDGN